MKQREKMLIHDKSISFTLIGMFFLTIVVVLNVIHIDNKQRDAAKQQEKERYTTCITYMYNSVSSDETTQSPVFQQLKVTKGNVIIIFNAVVGNGYSIAPIHFVCAFNEPIVEELNEGRLPTEDEILHGRKCVVIGEGVKRLTENVDSGCILRIDGISYDVIGILKDVAGDGTDNRVFVFQNGLASASLYDLDGSSSYYVEYGSNVEGELQTKQLLAWLYRFIPDSKLEEVVNEEADTIAEKTMMEKLIRYYTKFVFYGLFIFCILGCMIVSCVWMKRRKKEIIIRKALGSDMRAIVVVLLRDICIMLVVALLLSFAIAVFQSFLVGELWFGNEYMISNLAILIVAILLMMLVVLICTIYMACRVSVAEGTREQ